MTRFTTRKYSDTSVQTHLFDKYLIILLIIPLSILLFVIIAPIVLRQLFPVAAPYGDKAWRPTSKACFGIVVPQDVTPFILNERVTFMDGREKTNKCFGFDIYY